jgi:exodeoxyribonuclease (lambda-induced)
MIRHDMKQGSPEWNAIRRGKPTASEFKNILTPGGKAAKPRSEYLFKKAAERLGFQTESITMAALAYGHEMEPQAVRTYEAMLDVETDVVGFCTTDDGRYGASPDRKSSAPMSHGRRSRTLPHPSSNP